MGKTILYRLFGIGSVPKKLLPILEKEGIVALDEGISGWFITRNVKGPGKRCLQRWEGFSGCLVITKERVLCYTYWKRQINIAVHDPKISGLYVDVPNEQKLHISFEASHYRKGWEGIIEFQFNTEKALLFRDAFLSIGAQSSTAPDAQKHALP